MQSSPTTSPWQTAFNRYRKAIRDFTSASEAAITCLDAMRHESKDSDNTARCSRSLERVQEMEKYFKNQRAKTKCDHNQALTDDQSARLDRFVSWLGKTRGVLESLGHDDDGDWEREGGEVESDYDMADLGSDDEGTAAEESEDDTVKVEKKTMVTDK